MCGIIGCAGGDAAKNVYKGLVKLEYRGYDSAGISSLVHGRICTVKRAGMVSCLESRLGNLEGSVAIGHTRWATHGSPSDVNAHPHTCGKFSVVHNGIIENYASLKSRLEGQGAVFKSQTDSEVIAHLLDNCYTGDFLAAVSAAIKQLKGTFALCVMCADSGCIAVVRMRNPIIIGRGKGCFYASSDMHALAGEAQDAYVLKDGQIALISEGGAALYDFDLNKLTFDYMPVAAGCAAARLCGYPHYMLKEIDETPVAVKNTLKAFDGAKNALKGLYGGVNRIVLTGCGTAYHSALIAAYAMEEYLDVPACAEVASQLRSRACAIDKNTLLFAVSQSGETADTAEAARAAKEKGAKVVAVTNVEYCALNGIADAVVPVRAGTEVCVAATKSYCAQIASLIAAAAALSGRQTECADKIISACEHMVNCAGAKSLADICTRSSAVYFIGRGADYPAALEGSLKLKEVSYITGGGYPAGELKHGTLALIDKNTLTVAIITCPSLAAATAASVQQIRSRGGRVAVVAAESCCLRELEKIAEVYITVPDCGKYLSAIPAAIPLQLAAYYAAVKLGNNPDRPRNLAKSVTVE